MGYLKGNFGMHVLKSNLLVFNEPILLFISLN